MFSCFLQSLSAAEVKYAWRRWALAAFWGEISVPSQSWETQVAGEDEGTWKKVLVSRNVIIHRKHSLHCLHLYCCNTNSTSSSLWFNASYRKLNCGKHLIFLKDLALFSYRPASSSPPLSLLFASDLYLAGSGWWVGQFLPGRGLGQGVCAMVSCFLPRCSYSATEGFSVRPQDKG